MKTALSPSARHLILVSLLFGLPRCGGENTAATTTVKDVLPQSPGGGDDGDDATEDAPPTSNPADDSSVEASTVVRGPAACAAAGGRCKTGGPAGCSKVGTADCNPDRNPGGAVCCLDENPVDASDDRADATDAAAFCPAPLEADSGPALFRDVPLAAWCASSNGRMNQWSCGGLVGITVGRGVDCNEQHFFDAATGKLLANLSGCNGRVRCVAGVAGFVLPAACRSESPELRVKELCTDGG